MEDLRLRSNSTKTLSVTRKILGKHTFSLFSSLLREIKPVYKDSRFQRIIWLTLLNVSSLLLLINWCNSTRSVGLLSYTYLIFFDTLCLCICALSIWVEQKKPNHQYTFGYERLEVLAVFASASFSFISSFFTIKKGIGRWVQQTQIHTGRLFPGVLIAFICHMLVTHCMKNKGLNLVICASDSSWLQNRISSFNQSLSHVVPGISGNTCPRINPFSLLGCAAGGILIIAVFFIDIFDYHSADAIAGIIISFFISLTMFPVCVYTGKILLQATPPHIADLLDKYLREASTLDGVLEFRNEHFWLLGFDKIVGTIHVRVRRDANEQIVLSHLLNKLSSLVTDITIQVFKDEWAWSSTTRQILNDPFLKFPSKSETFPATAAIPSPNVGSPNTTICTSSSSYSSSSSSSSSRTFETKQSPGVFAAIPLPPSLSSSHSPNTEVREFSIEMSPGISPIPKPSYDSSQGTPSHQHIYDLQSISNPSKYSRELIINPMLTSSPNYGFRS
ncbi:zinc transporter 6-A [Parasteatoda tepidariorum]|uniref:zinc transporter 6-A n=1 Tax=Parasteatoda tepidariorum TaxID=114398 RepID=UPI00077F941A|nr:zinc transporter 6-A [Parasteatoda tepidariorum]